MSVPKTRDVGPPAEGIRIDWTDLPKRVRAAVEAACGATVRRSTTVHTGFSPGIAAHVDCADGRRFFLKGGSRLANALTVGLHRQEYENLRILNASILAGDVAAPRLIAQIDHDPWFLLLLRDMPGRHPTLPWRLDELERVLAELDRTAGALAHAPTAIPSILERHRHTFTGWRVLARDPDRPGIDPWARRRLEELAELEASWVRYATGETLLHMDLRADNLLLSKDAVTLVDWPHACRGAAFLDPVLLAPSVTMQGGPEPARLLAMSGRGHSAGPDALVAVVCALAGYFTERSLAPPPHGLPAARASQAAQGEIARRWLRGLL